VDIISKQVASELQAFYNNNLSNHGYNAKGVGWKNEEAQIIRFEQLSKIISQPATGTINDLGCGLGDFSEYLYHKGFENLMYVGYDVLEQMVQKAITLIRPSLPSRFFHILQPSQMQESDYIVASGIFNIRYDTPDDVWLQYILDTINHMHLKSRKGFAFNVLTKYSDAEWMKKELYYADPLLLFDYCKRNFSKNVALLHDYNQYDFTILVRKG